MRGFLHCALASLLLCVAWSYPHHASDHDHGHDHDHHLHHGKDEPHPAHGEGEDPCHKLASPNADFAFALYKRLSVKANAESKNVFFSPLGIATALSLLSIGAKGDTHLQLFQTLGYENLTGAQVNEGYEHLHHMLGHSQEALQLDMGNALALQEGFKPIQKFLDDAKHYYQAEGFTVDYKKAEEAVKTINKFVADKTQNKIPELLTSVDSDTLMRLHSCLRVAITSALTTPSLVEVNDFQSHDPTVRSISHYGKWEKPFNPENTRKADFMVDDTTTVSVDMMRRSGRYSYYNDNENHTAVLMVPYSGKASMMVLLPEKGKMKEVEAILSGDYVKHWHDSLYLKFYGIMNASQIHKHRPIDQEKHIDESGITLAKEKADLSGISEDVGLKVSKVSHKAVLSVDEKGTEAAAATAVEIMPMSLPDQVSLNRPFLLLIVEDSTRSILFMGKVVNPTAQ
ncbi:hypothetical protein JZ751_010424 [Albula glossodonta]|uniref:Serpin domain-containing protein n=1 Tax=Albula glossodonta TaxID=121402 RepID=A0A8T2P7X6_9TELE|nr:hypothetical protein JZ751_010424 [Albula glossodonta]